MYTGRRRCRRACPWCPRDGKVGGGQAGNGFAEVDREGNRIGARGGSRTGDRGGGRHRVVGRAEDIRCGAVVARGVLSRAGDDLTGDRALGGRSDVDGVRADAAAARPAAEPLVTVNSPKARPVTDSLNVKLKTMGLTPVGETGLLPEQVGPTLS